jgi:hypothetical protein
MGIIVDILKDHIKKCYCVVFIDDISIGSDTEKKFDYCIGIV